MSIIDRLLGRKKAEAEFYKVKFKTYSDFYGNFAVDYPKEWKYDPSVIIDEDSYAVVFHSGKTEAHFRVGVDFNLPVKFDLKEHAKKEIEDPSAGVYSKACKSKFRKYKCFETDYEYEHEGKAYIGEKKIFQTEDKVFSVFYTYPADEKENMRKIFNHMVKSLVIYPSKTKLFKRALR